MPYSSVIKFIVIPNIWNVILVRWFKVRASCNIIGYISTINPVIFTTTAKVRVSSVIPIFKLTDYYFRHTLTFPYACWEGTVQDDFHILDFFCMDAFYKHDRMVLYLL